MNPVLIIEIFILVLKLIASGLSEDSAISEAASTFGVGEDLIRNIF